LCVLLSSMRELLIREAHRGELMDILVLLRLWMCCLSIFIGLK
jgi:hypothetical protein